MNEQNPLVQIDNLTKSFPGVKALDGVSLELFPGEVLALIGENGAGKSTLIKILCGVFPADEGSVSLSGDVMHFQTPSDALKAGIKPVFQEIALIPEFTVAENIFMENHPLTSFGTIGWKSIRQQAAELFDQLGFDLDPDAKVADLPISQQQLVEITRAISSDAKVVVMDEPTSSLSPAEIKNLFVVINKLKAMGIAVIYVSHKLDELFEFAQRCVVLRDGCHVSTKAMSEHTHDTLIRDMVGREISDLFPKTEHQTKETRLEVKGVNAGQKLKNIDFHARSGEVVGFFGLVGAGRTELAKVLVGYDPINEGEIHINGEPLKPHDTSKAKSLGIGLMSEDRKEEGLMLEADVQSNMSLASLEKLTQYGFVSDSQEQLSCDEFVDRFKIKITSLSQLSGTLSGGNQQKVMLSRWLMYGLSVLVVDEPTRGIDVGAKSEIYALIDSLAQQGMCVVVMTSEMPELLGLCDRIYVMSEGRITAEYPRSEATQEKILDAAIQ
ncbi:ABC transporter-like protein [Vibrio nigripulchritudo ATCC 27043]|uniref:sugar ABC transporter ATP-binding protein n=1 Tax=Vibrio nigripulchritudo TaxID=28173 RepID=UPI00021C0D35|nr:sugar ABC transporter ATP-binding protein [Vibrio nigripulchritudo]EGU61847.1 ABC transporter-like protein [Vibrio nigripulchritudo ATCC 27043]